VQFWQTGCARVVSKLVWVWFEVLFECLNHPLIAIDRCRR